MIDNKKAFLFPSRSFFSTWKGTLFSLKITIEKFQKIGIVQPSQVCYSCPWKGLPRTVGVSVILGLRQKEDPIKYREQPSKPNDFPTI